MPYIVLSERRPRRVVAELTQEQAKDAQKQGYIARCIRPECRREAGFNAFELGTSFFDVLYTEEFDEWYARLVLKAPDDDYNT